MADLQLPYGIDGTGRIVTPDQVPRGAACGCVCTGCGGPLVAAQGEINRWHFRHAVSGADAACTYSPESDAHFWAKQIILDAGHITVPELRANHRGASKIVASAQQVTFRSVLKEARLADIVRQPDVLAETDAGPLAIEIFVAHRSEPEKLAAYQARGLMSIEIDLSGYRARPPSHVVLTTARRSWMFHPGKADADASFAIEEEERARLVAERAAELQRLRDAWAAARAVEREAELAAHEAQEAEVRARWEEAAAAQREERRQLEAEAAVIREAQRREEEIRNAEARRRRHELEVAAARSAVLVWERCWQDIPDGQGTLARARANLTATEARAPPSAAQ